MYVLAVSLYICPYNYIEAVIVGAPVLFAIVALPFLNTFVVLFDISINNKRNNLAV